MIIFLIENQIKFLYLEAAVLMEQLVYCGGEHTSNATYVEMAIFSYNFKLSIFDLTEIIVLKYRRHRVLKILGEKYHRKKICFFSYS